MKASSAEPLAAPPLLRIREACGFVGRARGLIGRPVLARGCGLLLPGVKAVHGFGMRHAVDLVFLDRQGVIVRCTRLPPWGVARCASASQVLEMRAGEARRLNLRDGVRPILQRTAEIFRQPGDDEDPAWPKGPRAGRRRPVMAIVQFLACFAAPALAPVQDAPAASTALDMPTLHRLQAEAESLYRDSAPQVADAELVRLYEALAAATPQRAFHAWLRIGNIHQRSGAVGAAIDAYRKLLAPARSAEPPQVAEEEARRKALLNLASLALEQARLALSKLTPLPAAAVQVEQLQSLSREFERQAPDAPAQPGEGVGPPGPDSQHAPYVVERYTASGRRNAVKAAKGSVHLDPDDELPAKPVPKPRVRPREKLPEVEYLLGDPLRHKPAADPDPVVARRRAGRGTDSTGAASDAGAASAPTVPRAAAGGKP